jgi:glycosyltransferase involved in cell wall biosynthesis
MSKKTHSLHVLMLGAFDPDYPRHSILRTGLEAAGVEVVVRQLPKYASTIQRVRLGLRSLKEIRRCDVILIPAFNQSFAPFVWMLTRLTRTPVLLDYMVGITDIVEDRATVSPLKAWMFRQIDRFNTRHLVTLTDTTAHREAFGRLLGGTFPKMHVTPLGVKPEWLRVPPPDLAPPLVAQFIGTYIPFQGVDVILRAAHLLCADARVRFQLIGSGQTYTESSQLAESLELTNVNFVTGFMPLLQLLPYAAQSTISLGVFGNVEKTRYVVPNKVYDGLAMGRAVITAESPAVSQFFTPGKHLLTVPPGDAEALASAIRALLDAPDRIRALGEAGQRHVQEAFLPEHVGAQVRQIVESLVAHM